MSTTKRDEEDPITTYVKVDNGGAVRDDPAAGDHVESWADDSPSHLYMAKRIVIGVIGVLLGVLTFVPNGMLGAMSVIVGNIGMFTSLCFIAGGIIGAMTSRPIWLFPAIVLQAGIFLYLFIYGE